MPLKITLYTFTFCLFAYALMIYFSDQNTSEREFSAMLDSGHNDLVTIANYLDHHDQKTDVDYDKALRLAATLDKKYLDQIIHYYAIGNLILDTSTALLILQQFPSESVNLNYAAGRIYATNEFNQYNPHKAVKHLEFAAVRGDKNSAAMLSAMYTQSSCYIEAITWAKEANKRASSSDCTKLPVNINLLNEKQLDAIFYNEDELAAAEKASRLPELRYSDHCALNE